MVERAQVPRFRNEPVLVLLLGVVTCGLYLVYWNVKMAGVINAVVGRPLISQPVAALSGCCMPVNVYFYYLAGQALPDLARMTGDQTVRDKSTLLVILGVFLPMVAAMIVQGHVNRIYGD